MEESIQTIKTEAKQLKYEEKLSKTRQRYRREWENDQIFKGWLMAMPEEPYQAFCKACRSTINARKKDLRDHSRCKKHARNMVKFKINKPRTFKWMSMVEDDSDQYHEIEESDLVEVIHNASDTEETFYKSSPVKKSIHIKPYLSDFKVPKKEFHMNVPHIDVISPREVKPEKCHRWCCQGPELPPISEDDFSLFGKCVGNEIRALSEHYDRQMAKMKVNKILFESSVGEYNCADSHQISNHHLTSMQKTECLQLQPAVEDDFTFFGRYVGNELRSLQQHFAQQTAKMKINEIVSQISLEQYNKQTTTIETHEQSNPTTEVQTIIQRPGGTYETTNPEHCIKFSIGY